MTLTELAIKRPSLIIVIFTVLIGGGLLSYKQLSYQLLPDFAPPILTVTTPYPGASPTTVENQVSKPMEDALSGLENIVEVTSFSMENASIVLLEFNHSVDLKEAMQDAQRKVENNKRKLPSGAETSSIGKIEPNAAPVLQVSATCPKMDDKEFFQLMDEEILPLLKQTKGVAEISIIGGVKREVRVNIDNEKLKMYNLNLTNVSQAIAAANIEFPTGKIKSEKEQMTVRLAGKFSTVKELSNLIITSNGTSSVKLSDVAEISDGEKDQSSITRFNGQNGIGLRITRQSDANAVEMAKQTRTKFKELEEKHKKEGLKFTIASDTSIPTVEAVDAVMHDLELAIILVAFVMVLFLHSFRNALIVLVSIPASLIATFIAMYLLGYTLNLMTLLAMSLVIGILVDDSIVVLENIYRHLKMGKSTRQAALDGRNEIGFTAVAITLVDVVVFLPLVFVQGTISDILQQFCIVVVISTLMSLFVCFTLTPWLASRFARETKLRKENMFHRVLIWIERRIEIFTDQYVNLLEWVLRHKIITFVGIIAIFIGTGMIMKMGIVGSEFVSQGDQGKFIVKLKYDKSTTFAENNATTYQIEQLLLKQDDVKMVFANVGGPSAGMGASTFGNESKSEITVKLKDHAQDKMPTMEYMNLLRNKIESKFTGIEVKAINIGLVESEEAPIEIFLSGSDIEEVMDEARKLKETILTIPGAKDPTVSTDDISPEVRIELNREKMGQLNVSTIAVGMQLQNALSGNDDSQFSEKGTEYDIRIMYDQYDRKDMDAIKKMTFTSSKGATVRLEEFADVSIGNGLGSLERKNRLSSTTIRAYILGSAAGTVAALIEKHLEKHPLTKSVKMTWGGEVKRSKEGAGAMGLAMLIGLILVYLILVALYDNFIYPLVILPSIFVALIGALIALSLSSSNFGVFTMLGVIMLFGLVAKNAILIVDFTNHLKEQGRNTKDALLESVKERMRPILMTTIAMVVGMFPIAMAKGSGAEWKNGLAWVLIGGLISSMLLTIILVPMLYYGVDRLKEIIKGKKKTSKIDSSDLLA